LSASIDAIDKTLERFPLEPNGVSQDEPFGELGTYLQLAEQRHPARSCTPIVSSEIAQEEA
jgi:hypothetical protein